MCIKDIVGHKAKVFIAQSFEMRVFSVLLATVRKQTIRHLLWAIFKKIIFAFALFILFSHIQEIGNEASSFTIVGLWRSLMDDLGHYYLTVWIPMAVLLIIWAILNVYEVRDRRRKASEEWEKSEKETQAIKESIEQNTKAIEELTKIINSLVAEIREDRNERRRRDRYGRRCRR